MPVSLSMTEALGREAAAPAVAGRFSLESALGESVAGKLVLEPRTAEWPGCLKMPKLMDFLCGWMLQEMVWAGLTDTQRTK